MSIVFYLWFISREIRRTVAFKIIIQFMVSVSCYSYTMYVCMYIIQYTYICKCCYL